MVVEGETPRDDDWDDEHQHHQHQHHRHIIERCYSQYPKLPFPKKIIEYQSWSEVISGDFDSSTLVFVDGGITNKAIDLGEAVLVNDGGIVKHPVACGIFFRDGGLLKIDETSILQRLLKLEAP